MNKLLSVDKIEYSYHSKQGLFADETSFHLGPISFEMKRGETLAIIGNNGSGKSLLAKALVGAVPLTKGSISLVLDNEDKSSEHGEHTQIIKAANSRDIRLILQHSADVLNPSLSVGTILKQTLRLNTDFTEAKTRQKIEDTLVKVGLLREHYYFYRHMLSDGQQQRVALARAILLDPKIIVADEPFAALDPSVRSQTINLILKLQDELGLGFVFISHNIGIVRHISDRVLVMDKGKIIEQGPTSEVFTEPQQALTQKLIQSHFSMVERHFSRL
ncbi:ATP-binding cassette domain-containing protein [Ningiella sp. W23]|uniref:ATP-binding cassette domain-containing protein n=1 Tax=Ningiella sp. W23 TaxID=3023715 RepID=UPI003758402C